VAACSLLKRASRAVLPRIATHIVRPDIRQFAADEKHLALTRLETGG
jgi:hypothetical protein